MKKEVGAIVLALAVISSASFMHSSDLLSRIAPGITERDLIQRVTAQEQDQGRGQQGGQADYWTLTVYIQQAKFGWEKVWIAAHGPFGKWVTGWFPTGVGAYGSLQLPSDQFPAGQKLEIDVSGPGITDLPTIFTRQSTGYDQTYTYIYHEDGSSEDLILQPQQQGNNNNNGDTSYTQQQQPEMKYVVRGVVTPPFHHYCPFPWPAKGDKCGYIPK